MMKAFVSLCVVVLVTFSCTKTEELVYQAKEVGASSNDLLASTKFTSLRIDLVYVDGFEPTTTAINNVTAFLQARLNKPGGITVVKTKISSPGLAPYSVADIQQVESDKRTLFNTATELTVFAFVADGDYADNSNVLGVAYKTTSVALFGKKINSISGGVGQPSRAILETTVLNHEFGHIMGLVNAGTTPQTNHQDVVHGRHCDVDTCLMFWAAETGDIVSNLIGLSEAPGLDSQCIADLKANGGK